MVGRISTIFQFILGFILGIILITGTAAGLGFLYVSKMTQTPPKPVFSEEKTSPSEPKTEEKPATTPESTQAKSEPETELEQPEELPPNAYKARVTWEQGLSLRDQPDLNATRIGGVEHNAEIIILEESQDTQWQRVRLPWSQQEGWVRGGNVERVY